MRTTLAVSLLCLCAAGPLTPAGAAEPMPAPLAKPAETSWFTQSVSTADSALKSLGAGAASVWGGAANLVTPSRPFESLPDLISDDARRFLAVLDAVGLRLSEIRLAGAVMSSSVYRLVAAREPSVADLERGERKLSEYGATSSGLRAGAKERIARAALDLAGDKDFVLTAVVIELTPWPTAGYEMKAREGR